MNVWVISQNILELSEFSYFRPPEERRPATKRINNFTLSGDPWDCSEFSASTPHGKPNKKRKVSQTVTKMAKLDGFLTAKSNAWDTSEDSEVICISSPIKQTPNKRNTVTKTGRQSKHKSSQVSETISKFTTNKKPLWKETESVPVKNHRQMSLRTRNKTKKIDSDIVELEPVPVITLDSD